MKTVLTLAAAAILASGVATTAASAQDETITVSAPSHLDAEAAKEWLDLHRKLQRMERDLAKDRERMTDAQDDVAKAQDRVEEAQRRLREQQKDLTKAERRLEDRQKEQAKLEKRRARLEAR